MDENVFGFVSIMAFGCGIYGLYAYIQMRKSGSINETLLLGKKYSEYMCRDKAAFVKKALPAVLVFGIVTTAYGVIDMIHCYVKPIQAVDSAGLVIFLGMLVWYMVYTTKLKNKYF